MSSTVTGIQVTKRGFLVSLILFFTFFMWYYVFVPSALQHFVSPSDGIYPMVYGSFNVIIGVSLMLGGFFIPKFNKIRVIYGCSIVISIATFVLLNISNVILGLAVIFMEGIFLGIGQLASLTYLWSLTVPEERGRMAGLAGFFIFPFYFIIWLGALTLDFLGIIILGLIFSLGMLGIGFLRSGQKASLTKRIVKKGYIPEKKVVLFYTIPWILFMLINVTFARNISLHVFNFIPSSLYVVLLLLQMIASGLGALGGGLVADLFGRRLSLVFSLTLYGISSALGGFIENNTIFFLIYVVSGLNWGTLWVLYGFVVWGDLSNEKSCSKRFSLGLTIFYLAMGVGDLVSFQVLQIPIIVSAFLSCALIFLSNIPLILAPEQLSEDFREKIKLTLYMNVIKKIRKKQSKNQG